MLLSIFGLPWDTQEAVKTRYLPYFPFALNQEIVHTSESFWKATLVEMIMTFFFVTFYIQIIGRNGAKYFLLNALSTGIAYFFTVSIAAGITGGCLNPMIGLVQSPFAQMYSNIINYEVTHDAGY